MVEHPSETLKEILLGTQDVVHTYLKTRETGGQQASAPGNPWKQVSPLLVEVLGKCFVIKYAKMRDRCAGFIVG